MTGNFPRFPVYTRGAPRVTLVCMPRRDDFSLEWARIGAAVAERLPGPLVRRLLGATRMICQSPPLVADSAIRSLEELVTGRPAARHTSGELAEIFREQARFDAAASQRRRPRRRKGRSS